MKHFHFLNSQQNTYYSLWVFFFTASAGVVGFIYGNDFARGSLVVKAIASILYCVIIIGNHHAINSTFNILNETRDSIQVAVSKNDKNVDLTEAIKLLQDSSLDLICRAKALMGDPSYLMSVTFILLGIWFSGLNLNQLIAFSRPLRSLPLPSRRLRQGVGR